MSPQPRIFPSSTALADEAAARRRFLRRIFLAFILLSAGAFFLPARADAESIMRSITIGWDRSPSELVIGYRLHWGQQSGSYSQFIEVGNQTTAEVGNLIEGTMYFFAVTAYSADGSESAPSEEFHYMPNPAILLNVSARARVQTGDDVMIVGFIVGGMGEKKIAIRALGPSLAANVSEPLSDPVLELNGPDGVLAANDNWSEVDAAALFAVGLAPPDSVEPALFLRLKPGAYTAIVRGNNGATGVALLEVYDCGN